MTNLRIGHGYDVHRLTEGRALILGGVTIPYEKGLLGHSDADVLTHAVMDALLGAAALGDIGKLFPDSADEFAGISSMELLRRVKRCLSDEGYTVVNVDATVLAQAPKLAPYREQMRANIAEMLETDVSRVSVKAAREWRRMPSHCLNAQKTESRSLRTDTLRKVPVPFRPHTAAARAYHAVRGNRYGLLSLRRTLCHPRPTHGAAVER